MTFAPFTDARVVIARGSQAAVPSSRSRPGTAYIEIAPCLVQPVRKSQVAGGLVASGS
jgi:hypothetical protein